MYLRLYLFAFPSQPSFLIAWMLRSPVLYVIVTALEIGWILATPPFFLFPFAFGLTLWFLAILLPSTSSWIRRKKLTARDTLFSQNCLFHAEFYQLKVYPTAGKLIN